MCSLKNCVPDYRLQVAAFLAQAEMSYIWILMLFSPLLDNLHVRTWAESIHSVHLGWGYLANFLPSVIFSDVHTTGYLLNTTPISDRCHRSLAAVVPVKYGRDSNDSNPNSAKSTENLRDRVLVTPTPGQGSTKYPQLIHPNCSPKEMSHFDCNYQGKTV